MAREEGVKSYVKQPIFRSEKWLRAVAALNCVICDRAAPSQAAHRNEGKGLGLKTDDALTAALCVDCHRDIDQGKELDRDTRRQLMDRAILDTIVQLVRRGKLVMK